MEQTGLRVAGLIVLLSLLCTAAAGQAQTTPSAISAGDGGEQGFGGVEGYSPESGPVWG